MKKYIILLLFTIIGLSINVNAQNSVEDTKILQKCIDLPVLQQYYPVDKNNTQKQLFILQHDIHFPLSIDVRTAGKRVLFLDKSQIAEQGIHSYFLFWEWKVNEKIAIIDFVYNYHEGDGKMLHVILNLQRTLKGWNYSTIKTERR